MPARPIYLASRSPRRRELLTQIGVRFELLLFRAGASEEVNEDPRAGETPKDYVERLAREKAQAGWQRLRDRRLPPAPVLAADTTVTVDGAILGKPADRRDAARMLGLLSGRRHAVLTAVAVRLDDRLESACSVSEVSFRAMTEAEIHDYVATGEADDKAGAYGIQGRAARFIDDMRGSYSGIMGLPLFETTALLARFADAGERRRMR